MGAGIIFLYFDFYIYKENDKEIIMDSRRSLSL